MEDLAAFYESEYRGGETALSFAEYLAIWQTKSAAARQLPCHLDLAYGPGAKETLDLFVAPNSTCLLVFIHGGYWYSMDKSEFSWIASEFVKAGISVALPNYDLCPTVTMAALVEQCRHAIAWLYHHAAEYGVSADRLVITGHSAGGHLTGMMFATDWSAYGMPATAIVGGVAISGLFNLDPFLWLTLNDDLRLDDQSAKALSPIRYQPGVSAPLVVTVGSLESGEFQRQTSALCETWNTICLPPLIVDNREHLNILDVFTDLNGAIWQAGQMILRD